MSMPTSHKELLSFSELLRKTFSLLERYFLEFIIAITVPLLGTYIFFWTASILFINDFNEIDQVEQLYQLFTWDNVSLYFILISLLAVAFINIMGLIAVPLVAVEHETITIRSLFKKSLKMFGPFLAMLIIIGFFLLILLIMGQILAAVTTFTLIQFGQTTVSEWYVVIINWIPTAMVAIGAFFFTFSPYMLLERKGGAWKAVKDSAALIWKRLWEVVLRAILMIIAVYVIAFILKFVPIVGPALAVMVSGLLLTSYYYTLYKDITSHE